MNDHSFSHEKISPTAKLVAYWRQFSDIPYAQDVASLFRVRETCEILFKEMSYDESYNQVLTAVLELRYKCIRHYLEEYSFKQVLEFASGIALRGLAMSQDPSLTYVETDLAGLSEEKNKLIGIIKKKYSIKDNDNLFFHFANILNHQEIEPVLEHFNKSSPLAIVHEGLFQYLSKPEKAKAAKNIHAILKKFGGRWISPDLDTKEKMHAHVFDPKRYQTFLQVIEKNTGCNFENNAFDNDDDIYNFFHELGFHVEWVPQMQDGIELFSLRSKVLKPELEKSLASLRLWVLTLRS